MANQNQPVYVLAENSNRTIGREAQRNNILAAKIVAETVRTTLGPKGMDKMLVDSLGDITVTNDGVTILEEMQIEHPAAKMIVEVAKTQEKEVGDGTTTAVILAGELLKNAEELLDKNIHPTVIIKGYRQAAEKAQQILNEIAQDISLNDKNILNKIAMTAITGKGAEVAKEKLADIAVESILSVENFELDDIKLETKVGAGIEDTELVRGIILDKEKVHSQMPKIVTNAKIALIECALEVKNTELDTKVQISEPNQLTAFLEMEEKMLRNMSNKIIESGANVVICQKGIDDIIQHFLAEKGIYAVRRAKKSDMERLAKATNGKISAKIESLSQKDLGSAEKVEEKKVGDEQMTYVTGCKGKSLTILIRGGTPHVVAEVERAIKDSLGDLVAALKTGKVVAGAGSTEIEVSRRIRQFATTLSGREQIAVLKFADALEVVPVTLAENAGLDPIDTLAELKAAHDNDEKWAGLDVFTGKTMNAWARGIIEPLKIKTQAINSATEVTELILRIDDVLAAGKKETSRQMPPEAM